MSVIAGQDQSDSVLVKCITTSASSCLLLCVSLPCLESLPALPSSLCDSWQLIKINKTSNKWNRGSIELFSKIPSQKMISWQLIAHRVKNGEDWPWYVVSIWLVGLWGAHFSGFSEVNIFPHPHVALRLFFHSFQTRRTTAAAKYHVWPNTSPEHRQPVVLPRGHLPDLPDRGEYQIS